MGMEEPQDLCRHEWGLGERDFGSHRLVFFLVVLSQRFSHRAPEKTSETTLSLL